jgi:hypothetical protein
VGTTPKPFNYLCTLPRVTSATNVTFFAHVDGSANNVLFKLNGGIPLNTNAHAGGDPRDYPPGWDTTDVYLGYEQSDFHSRIWAEKFGAADAARNQIGSAGAEVYEFTVDRTGSPCGSLPPPTISIPPTRRPSSTTIPNCQRTTVGRSVWPALTNLSADTNIWFQVKIGNKGQANRVYLYYTTDGTWPEGAVGMPIGTRRRWNSNGAPIGKKAA